MSLFEFTFGLSAVILGLALTHLASGFHRLAVAGHRVRWAPEPILLSGVIFLVIVSVWLFQWPDRTISETTIGLMLIQVFKLLLPYLAAAFVFPEHVPESGTLDLFAHYDRTRMFTFGALIAGLLLFWIHGLIRQSMAADPPPNLMDALARGPWVFVGIYTLLMFVRVRWLNIVVLAAALVHYGSRIAVVPLQG